MIAFPMRPHLQTQQSETCTSSGERAHYVPTSPTPSESTPSSMSASVLAPQRPVIPKRPKLSLQTSTLPTPFAPKSANALSISHSNDSPTLRNTYSNAVRVPSASTPTTRQQVEHHAPQSRLKEFSSPQASSASTHSSSDTSPSVPYYLPMGARSILRNSPLPPRLVSATSARTPRRIFPPIKRVMFHETLVEHMPTPIIEESEHSDTDSDSSTSSRKRARTASKEYTEESGEPEEPEDMPSTPVQGRCKRKREWIWTINASEDGRMSPDAGPLLRKDTKEVSEEEAERIADQRPMFREPITSRPSPRHSAFPFSPADVGGSGVADTTKTEPDLIPDQAETEQIEQPKAPLPTPQKSDEES